MELIQGGLILKWRIVGFNHPEQEKSLIYLQNLNDERLLKAVEIGIKRGCNVFSIRGFKEKEA